MNFFVDENALRQKITRELLNSFPDDLPGVMAARESAAAGLNFYPALRRAWEGFKDQFEQTRRQMESLRHQNAMLEQTLEIYRRDPGIRERDGLKKQLAELTARATAAEEALTRLQASRQQELAAWQREIERLREQAAEQNRVIARQHRQFVAGAGDEKS